SDAAGGHGPGDKLAVGADIPQRAFKGERHGESAEDERRRLDERVGDSERTAEGAVEQSRGGAGRRNAKQEQGDGDEQGGQQQGGERGQEGARAHPWAPESIRPKRPA